MKSWLDDCDYITVLEDGKILIDPEKLAIYYASITNESSIIRERKRIRAKIHKKFIGMKIRCYGPTDNSNFYYKRKGIQICQDWRYNFDTFYNWALTNGYLDGMEIDRIDNHGNYCPNNCQWLSEEEHNKKSGRDCSRRYKENKELEIFKSK